MKNKKGTIFITGIVAIIGLVGFIFLQFCCYELIGIYGGTIFLSDLRQFGIVITSGLLTGALLTFAISIYEYKNERQEVLEEIYLAAKNLEQEFSKIKYFLPDEPRKLVRDVFEELEDNERNRKFNKNLGECVLQFKDQQKADEDYDRNYRKLNCDAQDAFRNYIWENTDEQIKEVYIEPFQVKEYLDRECEKKIKKYREQLEDTMKSFLRFQEVCTIELRVAYEKIDFIFANKSIRYRIQKNLYHKLLEKISLIKTENFYFKGYFDREHTNKAVLCSIIWKLQDSLLSEDENFYYRQFDFDLTTEMVQLFIDAKGEKVNRNNFPKLKEYSLKRKPGYLERLEKQWEEDNKKNNEGEISNETEMKN